MTPADQIKRLRKALDTALDHVLELHDAWQCGAISEHDGKGGTRSNRNVDVELAIRAALAEPSEPVEALTEWRATWVSFGSISRGPVTTELKARETANSLEAVPIRFSKVAVESRTVTATPWKREEKNAD